MAEPKKKLSKTRTHRRRAQYKIEGVVPVMCKNCGKPSRSHTICPHCGFYDGVQVIGSTPTKRIVLDETATDAK
ncbi:MAG TPA: 50S ribosomal protein L32 [Candidatus Saccharimonadales bacterium]|nr:50S ribosomal protein L32 [Candidatus Saccharimonadales bacterium]